jgi:hypothetical protein
MKRPLAAGAIVLGVFILALALFAAWDLGYFSQSGQTATSTPIILPPSANEGGTSTPTPVQETSPAASHTYLIVAPSARDDAENNGYIITLKKGVSLIDGKAAVTALGGTVISDIAEISVIVAHLTPEQEASLLKNPLVSSIEINRTQTPYAFADASPAISSIFFSIAYADSSIKLFIIDAGAGPGVTYGSQTSILQGVDPLSLPESDGTIGHGVKVALSAQQIINQYGANVEVDSINVADSKGNLFVGNEADGIVKAVNSGANIINVSLGCIPADPKTNNPGNCGSSQTPILSALQYDHDHGVIVVTAAGDAPGVADPTFVGNPNVINVGGLDGECVDKRLSADTESQQGDFYASSASPVGDNYIGTSFSAPRMAGYIAVLEFRKGAPMGIGEAEGALKSGESQFGNAYMDGETLWANGGCIKQEENNPPPASEGNPAPSQPPAQPTMPTPGGTQSTFSPGGVAPVAPPANTFGPLVPKPTYPGAAGEGYTLCDLRTLANNLINFAIGFSVIVGTLMFAYGGVLYFSASGGGEAQIKKAHGVLLNTLVGIIIVLIAWLIVNIVLSVLTGNGIAIWTAFNCEANPSYTPFSSEGFKTANPPINPGGAQNITPPAGSCTAASNAAAISYGSTQNCNPAKAVAARGTDYAGLDTKIENSFGGDIAQCAGEAGIPQGVLIGINATECSGASTCSDPTGVGHGATGVSIGEVKTYCAHSNNSACNGISGLSDSQLASKIDSDPTLAFCATAYDMKGLYGKYGDWGKAAVAYNGGDAALQPSKDCPGYLVMQCPIAHGGSQYPWCTTSCAYQDIFTNYMQASGGTGLEFEERFEASLAAAREAFSL